jgi:hypothetical protein
MLKNLGDSSPTSGQTEKRLAFTIKETAGMVAMKPTSIYRLLKRGKLRAVPGFRHKIIPLAEIQRFLSTFDQSLN